MFFFANHESSSDGAQPDLTNTLLLARGIDP